METKALNSFIKQIRKTTDSESFESSSYGDVTEWIDTGDYALNRIISGDIYKGIPAGRVIALAGESQTGKSFIAAQIAANALKQGYHHIFYFDSEGGAMKGFFEGRGCDISKIEHVLVSSVQEAAVNILGVYAKILEFKKENPEYKALMVLDSLGACVNAKFLNDAANGKVASEMGGRAKIVNDMMKSLTTPALKTGTSIIVVNHVYDDPGSMFGSTIKAMGGGKGFLYMARIVLQCSRSFEQSDNKDKQAYKATVLKFMTTKNSLVKPFYKSEVYLNFEEGTDRYFGLLKPAIEYGFIENPSKGYYTVPSYSEKKMRLKEIMETPEIWETFLDDFNEKSKAEMAYSGSGKELNDDELEEMVDQFIEEDI